LSDAFTTVTEIRQPRGEQYFFIAGCMFVFTVAFSIDTALQKWKDRAKACLLIAVLAGGFLGNFRAPAFPDLHWRDSAAQIEAWRAARAHHTATGSVRVALNPAPVLTLHLPATFPELRITGIPDHLAASAGDASGAFAIRDALAGRYPDGVYVALPPVFGVNVTYRIRAIVRLKRGDTALLTAHGKMINESRAASAAAAEDSDIEAVETRLRTDDSAGLCLHIRGHSGKPPAVESVTITPF
jgi:hypothetical protein